MAGDMWHAETWHDDTDRNRQVTCDLYITCSSLSSACASLHIHPCRTWAGWADGPYASSILCKHDNSAFNSMLLVTCYVAAAFCLFTTFSRVVHSVYSPGHSRESQFNIHTSFRTRLHKCYPILLHKQWQNTPLDYGMQMSIQYDNNNLEFVTVTDLG